MPPKSGVPIKLGDGTKDRVLRYDIQAEVQIETVTGRTIIEHIRRIEAVSMVSTRDLLWAGLIHAEPNLTRDATLKLMDAARRVEYVELISKALIEAGLFTAPNANGDEPEASEGNASGDVS